MTLTDLRATLGIPPDLCAAHTITRGAHRMLAWNGPIDGRSGWWWAVTPIGSDNVVACGWAAGRTRDRDSDIAASLARVNGWRVQALAETGAES